MSDIHPYPMLYASGCTLVAEHLLAQASWLAGMSEFLRQYGVPAVSQQASVQEEDNIAIVQFCEPFLHSFQDRQWLIFAREEWKEGLWIGLDSMSAEVCRLDENAAGRARIAVLNRSLFCFLDFMEQLLVFLKQHPQPVYEAKTYTAEEVEQVLAAFRESKQAGQPIQRTPEQQEQIQTNRKLEQQFQAGLRKLKQSFRPMDAIAMKRNSWWKVVLEQLEDGIL